MGQAACWFVKVFVIQVDPLPCSIDYSLDGNDILLCSRHSCDSVKRTAFSFPTAIHINYLSGRMNTIKMDDIWYGGYPILNINGWISSTSPSTSDPIRNRRKFKSHTAFVCILIQFFKGSMFVTHGNPNKHRQYASGLTSRARLSQG